jgi:hypothetical protein
MRGSLERITGLAMVLLRVEGLKDERESAQRVKSDERILRRSEFVERV